MSILFTNPLRSSVSSSGADSLYSTLFLVEAAQDVGIVPVLRVLQDVHVRPQRHVGQGPRAGQNPVGIRSRRAGLERERLYPHVFYLGVQLLVELEPEVPGVTPRELLRVPGTNPLLGRYGTTVGGPRETKVESYRYKDPVHFVVKHTIFLGRPSQPGDRGRVLLGRDGSVVGRERECKVQSCGHKDSFHFTYKMRQKNFDWQQLSVETLRNTIRKLRQRAILFRQHRYGTRQTKQDLVRLLEELFYLVRTNGSMAHLHHRRLRFELYYSHGLFFLNPSYTEPL